MRELPTPRSLSEAVRCVIESNTADGYPPTRFIQITAYGTAPDLLAVCQRLIKRAETLEQLEPALKSFPTLLTLEDLVRWRGSEWGFDEETIREASARCKYFDSLVGVTRYNDPKS